MEQFDNRLNALFGPDRGNTEEDRAKRAVEFAELARDMDNMMLEAKKTHVEARDLDSVAGKLGAEFARLAANPDTTGAEKIDFLERLTQAFADAQSAALAINSGDMITETQLSVLKGATLVFSWIKPPYCDETLDFACKKRFMKTHFLDWAVGLLETAARVGKLPAVPAPMHTFSRAQVLKHGQPLHWPQSQPCLHAFLARGPCEWHCVEDAADRGTEADPTPELVCSLKGHVGCLFMKVVNYEGSNAFDFRYGHAD